MASAWRALPAFLLFIAPTAVRADERILHYLSDVQVQKDSSLEVTETIDVRAENDRINHGIYRDFPTRYRGPHGGQVRVGFTFEAATLDGVPVPGNDRPVRQRRQDQSRRSRQDRRCRRARLRPEVPDDAPDRPLQGL